MKRIYFIIAIVAAMSSHLYSQPSLSFRSAGNGLWIDSQNWETYESGVWLKPAGSTFPGDPHNRTANVTVDRGTVEIPKNTIVRINSLTVGDGKLVVDGILIIGPDSSEEEPAGTAKLDLPSFEKFTAPQLLQNSPNPVISPAMDETTIRFYLDRSYSSAKIIIYDLLGHEVQHVFSESNPEQGWHEIRIRINQLQSGSYPLALELPSTVLHKMITVIK